MIVSMKAVIMAGGEGTRLRPLTCDLPKPMARLCGRPVLEHILDLLAQSGAEEAAVTLRYLPEIIRQNFPSEEYGGMRLRFVEEDRPLGTAGSVRLAMRDAREGDEPFLVISGDALCDFDLRAAMRFHEEKQADATLLLSRVGDPREYGLVVTGPAGDVRGFVEKPGWAQAVTDAVNTGIYILSPRCLPLIPEDKPFDFAKDLFPLMLSRKMRVFGFEAEGYWCDIGDIGAYTSCQFDMLEGRLECRFEGLRRGELFYKGSLPEGNYTVKPPAYIGEGVQIGDFAAIGPYAVLDDGCRVGMAASVKNSVLLPDAYVGDHCELRGALVCAGASVERRAGMYEGSVAGAGSIVGSDASVSPGVRIWPGKRVEEGARVSANVKTGSARRGIFDDDGITGEVGADLTPEGCARIGAAAGGAFERETLGVACDGSVAGANLKNALAAGALSSGAEICDFGTAFGSLFRFSVAYFGLKMGFFVRMAGSRAVLELAGGDGLGVGRATERKIEQAVATGDFKRCGPADYRAPLAVQSFAPVYRRTLLSYAPAGLAGVRASAKSPNREVQSLFASVLRALGAVPDTSGGIRVHLDASGGAASFFDETGNYITPPQALALGCLAAFANGEDVALPFDAPRVLDELARARGRSVLRYLSCPADDADKAARALAGSQPWVRDGLANALRVLSYMKKRGCTLAELSRELPPFAVAVRAVACSENPGRLLRSLRSEARSPAEGVLLSRPGGHVLISPLKRGNGVRILAEAADMEAAGELCAEVEHSLAREREGGAPPSLDNGKKTD